MKCSNNNLYHLVPIHIIKLFMLEIYYYDVYVTQLTISEYLKIFEIIIGRYLL